MSVVATLVAIPILWVVLLSATHPWFKSGPGAPADQEPVLTAPPGQTYPPGTPSWVPLIDQCMAAGGSRSECVEALPPAELHAFRDWEQQRAQRLERRL